MVMGPGWDCPFGVCLGLSGDLLARVEWARAESAQAWPEGIMARVPLGPACHGRGRVGTLAAAWGNSI